MRKCRQKSTITKTTKKSTVHNLLSSREADTLSISSHQCSKSITHNLSTKKFIKSITKISLKLWTVISITYRTLPTSISISSNFSSMYNKLNPLRAENNQKNNKSHPQNLLPLKNKKNKLESKLPSLLLHQLSHRLPDL